MLKKLSITLACLLLAGCVRAASSSQVQPPAPAGTAIVGVSLIPMADGATLLPDQTILVAHGRIVAVGPRGRTRVPAGFKRVDGRGKYLMPGLADMHVHLEYIQDPAVLELFVRNGVTTVRSMDGRPYILDWRKRVASGDLLGPRIVTAGPIIDGSPPLRDDNLSIATPNEARAAVAEQAAAGYDFIKLYTNLRPDTYAAAVTAASGRGLRVAGHVPRGVKLQTAMQSQWSLEHLGDFASAVTAEGEAPPAWARRALAAPLDPARVEALAAELASAKVWVVPTSIQQDRWLARPREVERWLTEPALQRMPRHVLDMWLGGVRRSSTRMDEADFQLLDHARKNRLALIGAFHRRGVLLTTGTDTPNPFVAMGASIHQELANFVEAGIPPLEALKAATIAPARMLGLEREQGTVEVGKRADLLLLTGSPLADIRNTARNLRIMVAGKWLEEAGAANSRRCVAPNDPGPASSRCPE